MVIVFKRGECLLSLPQGSQQSLRDSTSGHLLVRWSLLLEDSDTERNIPPSAMLHFLLSNTELKPALKTHHPLCRASPAVAETMKV